MRKMLVVDAGSTNYTKRVVFEDGVEIKDEIPDVFKKLM